MPMMRAMANTGIARARITAACSNRSVNRLPSRPRNLDTRDPVVGAIRAPHLGRDIAVVLKDIQMAQGELAEIMRLARLAAVRAGEPRPAIHCHLNVQLLGPLVSIQPLSDQLPGWRYPKPQGKHVVRMHRPSLRRRSPA